MVSPYGVERQLSGGSLVLSTCIKLLEATCNSSPDAPELCHCLSMRRKGLQVTAIGWFQACAHSSSLHLFALQRPPLPRMTRKSKKRVSLFSLVWCWPWEPQLFSLLHVVTLETFLSPSKEQLPVLPLCRISLASVC